MLHSEARVATERAARYLAQLGRHADRMGRSALAGRLTRAHGGGTPPAVRHAEASGSRGTIDLGWGRCLLEATEDTLVLRAEAEDEEQLRRVQDGVAARLETIGRRDRLTVVWHRVDAPPSSSPPRASDAPAAPKHRLPGGALPLVVLGVLVVAAHVWPAGTAWTDWSLNALLAVLLLKLALLGGHGLLRRSTRHRTDPGADSRG